jgi:hypothetical protein
MLVLDKMAPSLGTMRNKPKNKPTYAAVAARFQGSDGSCTVCEIRFATLSVRPAHMFWRKRELLLTVAVDCVAVWQRMAAA